MKEEIIQIEKKAIKEVELSQDIKTLEEAKVKYLGKKGELTAILRGMGALSTEERPVIGSLVNEVREKIETVFNQKEEELKNKEMEEKLKAEKIDCAFVVLDPRQEESGSLGMEYFIKNVGAHFIFPMHCWEQYDIIEKYKKDVDRKFLTGQIMNITAPGQQFVLD